MSYYDFEVLKRQVATALCQGDDCLQDGIRKTEIVEIFIREIVRDELHKATATKQAQPAPADALAEAHRAIRALLAAPMVADAGADMKDEEDHAAERLARAVLTKGTAL